MTFATDFNSVISPTSPNDMLSIYAKPISLSENFELPTVPAIATSDHCDCLELHNI